MDIRIIIEIPQGTKDVKYEINHNDGLLYADRILLTSLAYPVNYGFIPNTKAKDDDPIDVLMICGCPLETSSIIQGRIIGALAMADEAGIDDKIIAVPTEKVSPAHAHIQEIDHIQPSLLAQIKHFFEHYKDLEEGKFTNVGKFLSKRVAEDILTDSIQSNK